MPDPVYLHINGSGAGALAGLTTRSFPFKLYHILEDAGIDGYSDIISWQVGGASFCVHKPEIFTQDILPKCFKQTKYKSFLRQLNIYDFHRIQHGPNKGGYAHQRMLRNRPELLDSIHRTFAPKKKSPTENREQQTHVDGLLPPFPSLNPPVKQGFSDPHHLSAPLSSTAGLGEQQVAQNDTSAVDAAFYTSLCDDDFSKHLFSTSSELLSDTNTDLLASMEEIEEISQTPEALPILPDHDLSTLDQVLTPNMRYGRNDYAQPFSVNAIEPVFIKTVGSTTSSANQDIPRFDAFSDLVEMVAGNTPPYQQALQFQPTPQLSFGGKVTEEKEASSVHSATSTNEDLSRSEAVFPAKLHRMLQEAESEGYSHIVSWIHGGTAFRVHDVQAFMDTVMVKYFDQTKFQSFRRQLNLYQFDRIHRPDNGTHYVHKYFQASDPELCRKILRPKQPKRSRCRLANDDSKR